MPLTDIIAHRIDRQSPSSSANITARQEPWALNGRIEELFRELKSAVLKRSGKDYGRFSEDRASFPFASWFDEYLNEKLSLASFTQKAMNHFKLELEKTEEPFDGYTVFAREKLEGADLFHIYIVTNNAGQCLDGDLNIDDVLYLDTSGIRLACKINITDWLCDEPYRAANAVALLRWRGEKDLSEAFGRFVGFTDKIDLAAETDAFLELVDGYTKSMPDDVAEQTRADVVDYCLEQDKVGKPVVIADLSTTISPAESGGGDANVAFAKYVASQQPEAKPELIPDKAKLRQFVRISGRNELLSMSFASACLGESIVYDPESDSLTIRNIPSALKSRLIKHLQKSG